MKPRKNMHSLFYRLVATGDQASKILQNKKTIRRVGCNWRIRSPGVGQIKTTLVWRGELDACQYRLRPPENSVQGTHLPPFVSLQTEEGASMWLRKDMLGD